MKKLQILMPMGGLGSRFAKAGFETPKPLIEVDGVPMFLKAISSLDNINVQKEFIFVIRKEHADELNLDTLIKSSLPSANVIIIPRLTRGASETAYAAKDALDSSSPLIVMDCDLWFNSSSYDAMVEGSMNTGVPFAGLLTFPADNPRYSYAEINSDNRVVRTAEKKVISSHAITGAYFFSEASLFVEAAERLLTQEINESMPEFYLSALYNILIDSGVDVIAAYIDKFASFGTPEELAEYQHERN